MSARYFTAHDGSPRNVLDEAAALAGALRAWNTRVIEREIRRVSIVCGPTWSLNLAPFTAAVDARMDAWAQAVGLEGSE